MTQSVFIETWGCQMNVYDSQRLLDQLNDIGLKTTNDPLKADVLLMNTCSIREKAKEKVFSRLGTWRQIKAQKPHLIIGVGGCVASQEGDMILSRAPYVDLIFGPQTLHRLPAMIQERREHNRAVVDISFPEIEKFDALPDPSADGPCAFVSIQEGCSKYCTYCIVPYTRGAEINRPFDDVIYEVATLAEQGVKEITFLGQNVNAYQGIRHNGDVADLGLLIRYAAAIDGVERIRFTTSHPIEFSDSIIAAYRDVPELVDHLHLPIQSGSNAVLKSMRRQYTVEQYLERIEKLKTVRPDIKLSSDFIVGYPGETDAHFQETLDLVEKLQFDVSYSFIYSPRPGTPAADMVDDIDEQVKKERLHQLQEQLQRSANRIARRMVGEIHPVLVTGLSKKDKMKMTGRTENNRVVNFTYGQPHMIGQIVPVHILDAYTHALSGQAVTSDSKQAI